MKVDVVDAPIVGWFDSTGNHYGDYWLETAYPKDWVKPPPGALLGNYQREATGLEGSWNYFEQLKNNQTAGLIWVATTIRQLLASVIFDINRIASTLPLDTLPLGTPKKQLFVQLRNYGRIMANVPQRDQILLCASAAVARDKNNNAVNVSLYSFLWASM